MRSSNHERLAAAIALCALTTSLFACDDSPRMATRTGQTASPQQAGGAGQAAPMPGMDMSATAATDMPGAAPAAMPGMDMAAAPAFGGAADVERATTLWQSIQGYETWPSFPGREGIQVGGSPHGAYVSFHLNPAAAADPSAMAPGAIVIKNNYADEAGTMLGAVTVMEQVAGYSPMAGDWFFAKYLPDGSLDQNEAGVPLAGAVGLGGTMGCIPCHSAAPDGDYLYANSPVATQP